MPKVKTNNGNVRTVTVVDDSKDILLLEQVQQYAKTLGWPHEVVPVFALSEDYYEIDEVMDWLNDSQTECYMLEERGLVKFQSKLLRR